jgi:hypothetical protein
MAESKKAEGKDKAVLRREFLVGSGGSARTGGFCGVFGSKNLKAISVIETGSIKSADPKGVVDTRLRHMRSSFGGGQAGASSCMPCVNSDRKRNSFPGG